MADQASNSGLDLARLAAQMESNLETHVLAPWYPAAVDNANGGFKQEFDEAWKPGPSNRKSIVYQSRLTWVASQVSQRYPDRAAEFRKFAGHGLRFLRDVMWDKQMGGFYWEVADGPGPVDSRADRRGEKHAYGVSFGIYAAAACYRATHNDAALDLAKRGFRWLEQHAHDAKNGGYFEALSRDGKPILTPPTPYATDFIGTRYGFKSMNSHIHLLEALTELYEVWPDKLVKERLNETFHIVRDKVAVFPGCLNLFFTPDWRPVPDHDSFGHDVETAYLLIEAAKSLRVEDMAETWKMARLLVDHALDFGWDNEAGGFYDKGSAFNRATDTTKVWWIQAEGLNALLLLHRQYGASTPKYAEALKKQWDFIQRYQVDAKNHGWYSSVEKDGQAPSGQTKSNAWTDPYHQGRALMNCIATLKQMTGRKNLSH
jgi:mannobiose 2-epimerase